MLKQMVHKVITCFKMLMHTFIPVPGRKQQQIESYLISQSCLVSRFSLGIFENITNLETRHSTLTVLGFPFSSSVNMVCPPC